MKRLNIARRHFVSALLTFLLICLSISFLLILLTSKETVTASSTPSLATCGPYTLALAGQRLGVKITKEEIIRLAGTDGEGTTMYGLCQAARKKGLKAVGMKLRLEDLEGITSPVIAYIRYKNKGHYVVIERIEGNTVTVTDSQGDKEFLREEFEQRWQGEVLIVTKG